MGALFPLVHVRRSIRAQLAPKRHRRAPDEVYGAPLVEEHQALRAREQVEGDP